MGESNLGGMRYFKQEEYNRILDTHSARKPNLSQTKCERILMACGASYNQAKNGAYVYLHHSDNFTSNKRGTKKEYTHLLDNFNAINKSQRLCVKYLEGLGYSYGQAHTAVYNYRHERGLIGN